MRLSRQVVAAVACVLCTPAAALAAFPGRNGELVVAAACSKPAAGCHGLEVVRPDGSGLRLLCPKVPACAGGQAPEWSPDGTRVAFESSLSGPLYPTAVVYADGSCLECQGLPYAHAFAWIATVTPLPGTSPSAPYDQLGLYDALGSRILEQGNPGDLSGLGLSGTTISWLDRGQPRSATIAPR